MAKSTNRLTARQVTSLGAGLHRDGDGLLLRVEPSGARRWLLRISAGGKRRELGLGSAAEVTLASARAKAIELRREIRAGADPLAQRQAAKEAKAAAGVTFREAAEKMLEARLPGFRNAKHQQQWRNTLSTYVYPVFGDVPVGEVASRHVLAALEGIWLAKPETARRVRQRIGVVLEWAVAAGLRSQDASNAAEAVRGGLPRQPRRDGHHEALPWLDVPDFIRRLRGSPTTPAVRLGLEFTILTAARTGETLGATWAEFDLDGATWTIPAARMKAKLAHRVPLSRPTLAILRLALDLRIDGSEFVFPGRRGPLSQQALLMPTRRLTDGTITVHGFRSSFRDWAADGGHPRELAEAALAHSLGKVEAAYRRSDLLEQRRPLMEAWGTFCDG